MRRLTILTVIAATLVLAAPGTPASANPSAKVVVIRGSDSGTFTMAPIDATHVKSNDVAVGRATHVGRYTLNASEEIDLATLAVTNGEYTVSAANGDTVFGSYAGTAAPTSDPAVITYHVGGPVTGGTGRFAHASGWLTFDGVANLATGDLSDRMTGWVRRAGH